MEQIGRVCESFYMELYAPENFLHLKFDMFDGMESRYKLQNDIPKQLVVEVSMEEI